MPVGQALHLHNLHATHFQCFYFHFFSVLFGLKKEGRSRFTDAKSSMTDTNSYMYAIKLLVYAALSY
jgi:hypothetical protein